MTSDLAIGVVYFTFTPSAVLLETFFSVTVVNLYVPLDLSLSSRVVLNLTYDGTPSVFSYAVFLVQAQTYEPNGDLTTKFSVFKSGIPLTICVLLLIIISCTLPNVLMSNSPTFVLYKLAGIVTDFISVPSNTLLLAFILLLAFLNVRVLYTVSPYSSSFPISAKALSLINNTPLGISMFNNAVPLNVLALIVVNFVNTPKFISFNLLQFSKALAPMLVVSLDNVTFVTPDSSKALFDIDDSPESAFKLTVVSESKSANALAPITVPPFPAVTVLRLSQPSKAFLPIVSLFTFLKSIDFKLLHPLKALSPILVIFVPLNVTVVTSLKSEKTLAPILRTLVGILIVLQTLMKSSTF